MSAQPDPQRPPLYTVWEEFCGWTFDRTASIPKSGVSPFTLAMLKIIR